MRRVNLSFFFLIFLGACAHQPSLNDKQTYQKYKNDTVSVKTALNLARTSYVVGCVKAKKAHGVEHPLNYCQEKAHQHVQENIIFILEQN